MRPRRGFYCLVCAGFHISFETVACDSSMVVDSPSQKVYLSRFATLKKRVNALLPEIK